MCQVNKCIKPNLFLLEKKSEGKNALTPVRSRDKEHNEKEKVENCHSNQRPSAQNMRRTYFYGQPNGFTNLD